MRCPHATYDAEPGEIENVLVFNGPVTLKRLILSVDDFYFEHGGTRPSMVVNIAGGDTIDSLLPLGDDQFEVKLI